MYYVDFAIDQSSVNINTDDGAGNAFINQNNPIGYFGGSCLASNNRIIRINDTTGSDSDTSTAALETGTTIKVGTGSNATGGIGAQFAAWGIGDGLSVAQHASYENRIRTYMQARGADVY